MKPDCLVKLKPLVSDTVYQKLEEAQKNGDQKLWDFTMHDAHADVQLLKRRSILKANRRNELVTYIKARGDAGTKPSDALMDLLSGSGVHQGSGVVSLDRRIQAVRAEYSAMNIDFIDATKTTMLGLRRAGNPDFIENIVKGIFKDADANIPKGGQAIIDGWHKTLKAIAERYNGLGGNITELAGYNLPANHYAPAILKAGEKQWATDVARLFNVRRKQLKVPDKAPLSDYDIILKSFKAITEEGGDLTFGVELGKHGEKVGGSSSHELFRTLQPKSGAAWMEYTKKYGVHTNPVDAMKEYISTMSKEIGLLEVLGPDYKDTMEALIREARRSEKNPHAGDLASSTFDHIKSRLPRADDSITNTFRGLRAIQTITKLPMATVTAISDVAFSTTRALYLGMNPFKVMSRQITNLATMKDYKTAGRLAMFVDYANHAATVASRYTESVGFSKLDRVADFALRANGLNHWTNSGKATFSLEMLSFMADNARKNAADIPKGLQRAFARYGITEGDWDTLRKATTNINGTDFIDPMVVEGPLKSRLIGMIIEETSYAVPEPNAKVRAYTSLGTQKNTVWHEVVSTGLQFKTFGATTLTSTLGMALDKALPLPTKLAYGATLLTTTTAMGMAVLQLRDIAKGRTPREMSPGLVKEAMMQGGFLGVAGDLFFQDPDLFGGLPGFIAGPTVSDLNRIKKVMFGTYDEVMKEGGDWAKVLFPAIEQAAEEAAFPLKLWQTRVMAERLMLDHARRLTDPAYYDKLARSRDWMEKEHGQEYWSTPK